MKVIYRAYDGVDFDTEIECRRHEADDPLFKMWTGKGMTQDIEAADVIEIFGWDGYENFKELCGNARYGVDGPGVYAWNGDEWVEMTNFPFSAVSQYLRASDVE